MLRVNLPCNEMRGRPGVGLLALCTMVGLVAAAAGAEPWVWVPSANPPPSSISEDLELSLRARQLLQQDEQLAGQTVGVTIHHHSATLWGPVSSAGLAARAEECLRNLPGLLAVRNELWIEPRASAFVPDVIGRETRQEPLPSAREPRPTSGQTYAWRPARSLRPANRPASEPERPAQVSPPRGTPTARVIPGYPSADRADERPGTRIEPERKAAATVPVMPTLRVPPLPVGAATQVVRGSDLAEAVETLRLADERFHGVQVRIREGIVHLGGRVYRWEHLFELAQAVARLPGSPRVLFDEVRVDVAPQRSPAVR